MSTKFVVSPNFPPNTVHVVGGSGVVVNIHIPILARASSRIDCDLYDGDPRSGGELINHVVIENGMEGADFLEAFDNGLWVIARSWSSFVVTVDSGYFSTPMPAPESEQETA